MMLRSRIRVSKFNNLYSISDSPFLRSFSSYTGDDDGDRPSNRLSGDGNSRQGRLTPSNDDGSGDDDDLNYQGHRRQQHNRFNPNQQPRQEGFSGMGRRDSDDGSRRYGLSNRSNHHNNFSNSNAPRVNKTNGGQSGNNFPSSEERNPQNVPPHELKNPLPHSFEDHSFLEKFKLGFDQGNKKNISGSNEPDEAAEPPPPGPPPEAEEIFKRMKETGLIPNAVAMLHGLCNEGLVHEAMKLFGLMREKGTIPEVIIYTAVVEGFCKAQKLEDAKRIFKKMQNNGISANAFSYSILIQGLYKGNKLDDALEICLEMLEAGHSPNMVTFTGLVDGFCRERGREAAEAMIATLRRKGYLLDEKAAKEFMGKNGSFSPLVWEAIFGIKKSSPRPF